MTANTKLYYYNWKINDTHIDHYGHVNNARYVEAMEATAWQHSNALGITLAQFRENNCAMVITKHAIDYHQALYLGQDVACFTWIQDCPNRLRLRRGFAFFVDSVPTTPLVLTALTDFVCVKLDSGRAQKMPKSLYSTYANAVYNGPKPESLAQAQALSTLQIQE